MFGSPYDAATGAYSYNDVESMLQQYLGKYMNAGDTALMSLEEQYQMLLNNPSMVYDMLAADFEASPGYEYQVEQSMNASNNAAAAGGMLGTPAHTTQSMSSANDLAAQDYWNYMGYMNNLYNTGLGVAGDINQMGYNASSTTAAGLGNYMASAMNMAYMDQVLQNKNTSSLIGGGLGMASSPMSLFGMSLW